MLISFYLFTVFYTKFIGALIIYLYAKINTSMPNISFLQVPAQQLTKDLHIQAQYFIFTSASPAAN
jgi:hypothetical protein